MEDLKDEILRSRTFKAEIVPLPKYFSFNVVNENDLIGEKIDCLITETSFQKLNEDWSTFVLDYARLQDLNVCAKLAKEAANVGDNVGQDEFEGNELFEVLKISEIFVLKSLPRKDNTADIKAFISIQPYFGSRTLDSCQTLLVIYYDQEWMNECHSFLKYEVTAKDVVYCTMALLGIKLIKEIRLGYTDVIMYVCPKTHPHRLRILNKIGFNFVASVPRGICINGCLEEYFIFLKSILPPRKPREQSHVTATYASIFNDVEVNRMFFEKPFKNISILPRLLRTTKGSLIRLRMAERSEVDLMYSTYNDAAKESDGYGINEFPTLSFFKMLIMDSYNVIYELVRDVTSTEDDVAGGKSVVVACSIIRTSWHSRSRKAKIAESSFVIKRRFRNLGLGIELTIYLLLLMKHLGYTSTISDFLESNFRIRRIIDKVLKSFNPATVGFIPRSNFNSKFGWEGQVIQYSSLNHPKLELLMSDFLDQPVTCRLFSKL